MWKKHAWQTAEVKETSLEIERLVKKLSGATVAEFDEFARHEIVLEAFARFVTIDIAFGSQHRDFRRNHRLHFDPYAGRWELVARSFRVFRREPACNLADNPILLRLKRV